MRSLILFLAWSSFVGSLIDAGITLIALCHISSEGWTDIGMSVDAHLKKHIMFLYFVKDIAFFLFPDEFVLFIFNAPALVIFPLRVIISAAVGAWLLALGRKIKARPRSKGEKRA